MEIGIVGLGMIGGSFAKAIKAKTEHTVYAYDIADRILKEALLVGAIDGELTDEVLGKCDLVIVALYPQDTIDFVKGHAGLFKKDAIVTDCCGIKTNICNELIPVAEENGFIFIGGHPMAGVETCGFRSSDTLMFEECTMIFTKTKAPIQATMKLKEFFETLGFAHIRFTTPEEHDRKIAFTSQLSHVISSAYVKSTTAEDLGDFSGGSFKDMSRIAGLNETMWTELFLENNDNLSKEIDMLIGNLQMYSDAIKNNDSDALMDLLKDGSDKKHLTEAKRA